jgi:hypothetical protein
MIDRPEQAVLHIHLLSFQIQVPIRALELLLTEHMLLILELGNRRECKSCSGLHPLLLLWLYQKLVRDAALLKFNVASRRYRGEKDRVILITYLLRDVLRLFFYLRESLKMSASESSSQPG